MSAARPARASGWPLWALLAVTALGALGVRCWGRTPPEQSAAWLGVGLSAGAGSLALAFKRLALARGIRYALGTTGVVFVVRLALLGLGVFWVRSHGGAVTAFVVGFLVVFGASQWVEIGYLATAARGRA